MSLCWVFQSVSSLAAEHQQQATQETILEVYVREGCPHCARAEKFLHEFNQQRPGLRIVYRFVDHDDQALAGLINHSKQADIWPPGVPTFVINGQIIVGFDNAEHTGGALSALIDQTARNTPKQLDSVESPLFGKLSVSELGMPLFTLAIGLLDGFNPCAMWVLLFLLSFLVHLHDRKRMAVIAGTFVLVSGLIYYAFMTAWLNIFLFIGFSATIRIVLGGLALFIGGVNIKDALNQKAEFSLSIPDSAKPGIYARMRAIVTADRLYLSLTTVIILAILVNFIELLCTAGFPAIYTAILTQQELGLISHYAYLGLYILGYIADDALMVATAVIALSSQKLTEHAGHWLKLISGLVMVGLGGLLILFPEWLV
ncbi:MAG: glutaredoxin family protein [Nitrosomonas sp.]|nr:glutaredoxin family protein [Nitrosomonas sp.]